MVRWIGASLFALVLAAPARAQSAPAIDSMALRAHTYFLSHDLLEGRGTATRGGALAALYLASAARRLGLSPVAGAAGYLQDVPLVEAGIDTIGTMLSVTDSSGTARFPTPSAFIPNAGSAGTLVDFSGGLAWVGRAADVLAHPAQLPDLSGRAVIMVGMFGADAAAADTLRARGATGVIHYVGEFETYRLYVNSRGESRMYIANPAMLSSFIPPIPSVIARAEVIRRLLPAAITDEALERPFLIPARSVRVTIRTRPRPVPAQNVIAWLPGADPALRSEYVVYTAHYDHLGIGEADARGDSIYNGFSDNAAGSAMLLAIAQYFVAHRPARSILFLWFTGEERGLLGSDYYVAQPLLPLERINGVINLDAGAPPAPPALWRISGADRSPLGAVAIDVARRAGWEAQAAPASPNTDYFPFLRMGVPAVFLVPGPGPYEGLTSDSSQALRARWDHYHQAADNWAADFPFGGLVRYADFALRLGMRIASGPRLQHSP